MDDQLVVKVDLGDALEALAEVGLHARRVLGLGQDLEQLVIREEEEAREREALGLEVVVEPLLDELEQPVGLLPRGEHALGRGGEEYVGLRLGGRHDLAPEPVDLREALRLLRHLAHDVLGREDGLEVEPDGLALEPLVDNLLHRDELRLPVAAPVLERLDKGRAAHRLGLDDVVVEHGLDLVERAQDVRARVAVLHAIKLDRAPLIEHLVEGLLERKLLRGRIGHLLDLRDVVAGLLLEDQREGGHLVGLDRLAHLLSQLLPVPVAHARVEHRADQGQVLLEVVDLLLDVVDNLEWAGQAGERLAQLVQQAPPVAHVLLHLLGRELHKRPLEPQRVGALEVDRGRPERVVRLERLVELVELRVLGHGPAEELFTRVVQGRALLAVVDLRLEGRDRRRVRLDLGHVAERGEGFDLDCPHVELLRKVLAVRAQLLLELFAILLLLLGRVGRDLGHAAWPAERREDEREGLVGELHRHVVEQRDARLEVGLDRLGELLELNLARGHVRVHLDHLLGRSARRLQLLVDDRVCGRDVLGLLLELLDDEARDAPRDRLRLRRQALLELGARDEEQPAVDLGHGRIHHEGDGRVPLDDELMVLLQGALLRLNCLEVRLDLDGRELLELLEEAEQCLRAHEGALEKLEELHTGCLEGRVVMGERLERRLGQPEHMHHVRLD